MNQNRNRHRNNSHQSALNKPLEGVAIELTTRCNLSCRMCSVWKRRGNNFDSGKIISLLDEARALGAFRFYSCGAEPFMRRDTHEILAYAERTGFRESCVVSNGLLLNNGQILDKLQTIRNVNIVISLDGPKDVHDDLRGTGTFDGAVDALSELRRRGITCSMASIIMRQTLDRLNEVVDLAADLGIPVISMQPYQPETAGLQSDHSPFEFSPDEEEIIREKLNRLMRYAERKKISVYTASMMKYVPPYLARGIRHVPPGGCFVPAGLLVAESSGNCFPCFMMRERMKDRSMGNVFETSLDEIWHGDVHQELTLMALNRTCPGCLASCSDVDSYDALSQRGFLTRHVSRMISRFVR